MSIVAPIVLGVAAVAGAFIAGTLLLANGHWVIGLALMVGSIPIGLFAWMRSTDR